MAKNLGSLNIGDLIEVPVKPEHHSFLGERIVFKVADKNHPGYPENSVTLITDKIIAAISFDAVEPTSPDPERRFQGNNRYSYSNILQWMNSDAEAGEWYTPQHPLDSPPSNNYGLPVYTSLAGFLKMLDEKFVSLIGDTSVTVAIDTKVDGGGSEIVTSKMFLASATEIVGVASNGVMEGLPLSLFTDAINHPAYPTTECVDNYGHSTPFLKKAQPFRWYLRSVDIPNIRSSHVGAFGASFIGTNLTFTAVLHSMSANSSDASLPCGFRPLCNVPENRPLTDTPNSRGNYEILPSEPPSISGTDSDLQRLDKTTAQMIY